jgi:NADPH2:quinone reductase
MQAIASNSLEGFESYESVVVPDVAPGPAEVRIRVEAVGLGYVDALIARGGYQVKPELPHIPGVEVAGTIDAVGADVVGWAVGDRVLAMTRAGLADAALAPAAACYRLPEGISVEQAAAFPLNHLTAIHGLLDRGRLQAGETLLVFGAAGGVGLAAISVGKLQGATVIAAASTPEKRARALQHGADLAIDVAGEGWRERLAELLAGRRLDVVFDPVMGPLFEPAFRSLGWGGRHLVVGFVGGPIPALRGNLPLMKGAGLIGVDVRQFQLFEPQHAAQHLTDLVGWLAEGPIKPPPVHIFPWAAAQAALAEAFRGSSQGKVVLSRSAGAGTGR